MRASRSIAAFPARLLPPSPVGAGLARAPWVRLAALAVGVVGVALDLRRWSFQEATHLSRLLPALAGLAVLAVLAHDPKATLGLRGRPLPSWGFWLRATLLLGGLLVLGGIAFFTWVAVTDTPFPLALQLRSRAEIAPTALRLCVLAPLVEEPIYRGLLVPALVPVLRPWGAVLASGIAFAALHHLYGNVGPDNQVVGFVLAWAFLRSGSLWVPVALHAAGNAAVLVLHLGIGEGWWTLPGVVG